MDATGLALDIPATANALAIVHANADMWTATSGFNQDLGIFIKEPGNAEQLIAWKESGGRGGTFSPNAAFVQTVVDPHLGFHVSLKWKSNLQASGGTIFACAGLA